MLIGFTGKARSGKDTAAGFLIGNHAFNHAAFATSLKEATSVIFGIPLSHCYEDEFKDTVNTYWGMSPRAMMQKLGTEACRGTFGADVWISSLEASYQAAIEGGYNLAITDVRFDNEAEFVRSKGGTIVHVVSGRESTLEASTVGHASEDGVFFVEGDVILNNRGTIQDLEMAVSGLVHGLKGKQ